MRTASVSRRTQETDIEVSLNIDGEGLYEVDSGVPFFDHMLSAFAKHSLMDVTVVCKGDTEVDDHHSLEDIGIALGAALGQALGDKRGIVRYATSFLPMDEALVMASIDVSGRPFLVYDVPLQHPLTGAFDGCLMEEFLRGFAFAAGVTLHIRLLYGSNTHHILEAVMKALARALDGATAIDSRVDGIPSTKGVL